MAIPIKRLNQNMVQNPSAGIKLNTECNVPRKIIIIQFSTNNIAAQKNIAILRKANFEAVLNVSYDVSVFP
jgi:hypothetical protein